MSECLCKVKKGLECCSTGACKTECPYFGGGGVDCGANLSTDALQIITEQENMLDEKQKHLENLQKVNEDLEERIAIMEEGTDNGWIPVSARFPEDDEDVLVCINGTYRDMAYRDEGRWYNETHDILRGVTHWMHLPEPPKEGEQDDT